MKGKGTSSPPSEEKGEEKIAGDQTCTPGGVGRESAMNRKIDAPNIKM